MKQIPFNSATVGTPSLGVGKNFRPAYSAERGEAVYQRNLRNRGRHPKKVHDDYKAAPEEVKHLNAAEREKQR